MCCERIENATELYCFKITYDDGKIVYYVDSSMSNAVRSASEIWSVKLAEFIGQGAIGN